VTAPDLRSLTGLDTSETPLRRGVRLLAGVVYAAAGTPKFFAHGWEAGHFRTYGLPWPDAFVYLIGAIEILGGLALIAGIAVRPVALLLGAVMVGAIVTSGIGQGEWIPSLTLAPALLVASVYLTWTEPRPEPGARGTRDSRRTPRASARR
jgi:putative oxidoreductase